MPVRQQPELRLPSAVRALDLLTVCRQGAVTAALACVAQTASAQAFDLAALRLVPIASATETLTNNYRPGFTAQEADSITQIGAGFSLTGSSRRMTTSVNYLLSQFLYARHHADNQHQQSLNGSAHLEWLESHGFLDVTAAIARQSISAFGTQTSDSALVNGNSTESRSLRIAPSLRGRLVELWNYEADVDGTLTRTGASGVGNTASGQVAIKLNRAQLGRLSWSLVAQRAMQGYQQTRHTFDGQVYGSGQLDLPEADLKVSAHAGRQNTNVATANSTGSATWGVGLNWTPSQRTHVDAQFGHQQYGATHSVSADYRTARTVWHMASSQAISAGIPTSATTTNFNLFFDLFAAQEPDPVKRTQLVNAYLQQNGINPNGAVQGSFITRSTTQSNLQLLSFALQGIRSALTVSALFSDNWQLDPTVQLNDNLANGQHVRQRGLNANLSHRLTPSSALNLTGAYNVSNGSASQGSSTLKSVTLGWTGQPSRHATVTASARHSSSGGSQASYSENAAIVALNLHFN